MGNDNKNSKILPLSNKSTKGQRLRELVMEYFEGTV